MWNEKFKTNIVLIFVCFFVASIVVRLCYLQIYKRNFYADIAKNQSSFSVDINQNRGTIKDRNGELLSENIHTASIYVNANKLDNPGDFIRKLKTNGIYLSDKYSQSILKKNNFVWLDRGVDIRKAEAVSKVDENIGYVTHEKRFYPQGSGTSKIVGFTGIDNQGLEGVESYFDNRLKGDKIQLSFFRDSRKKTIVFENRIEKIKNSGGITLSIDAKLQKTVLYILQQDVEKFEAKSGFAAAIDVNTGEILFSASFPSFDSNNYQKYQKYTWKDNLFNYLFEPGSIFKGVTFSVLSENSKLNLNKKVDCEKGSYRVYNHIFNDVHKYETITSEEVFVNSSNIGTIKLTEELDSKTFYNYLEKFGFGQRVKTDGAYTESGHLRNVKDWSGLSKPSISIGQEILVTPVHILQFYSAIANGGYKVQPKLIRTGKVDKERIISEETSNIMQNLMKKVVLEGTGKNADSKFFGIAGKTGTAQKFDMESKSYSKTDYNAGFAGFFPAENPKFAMIVIYDSPRKSIYGGSTSAYTFKRIAEQTGIKYGFGAQKVAVNHVH